MKVLFLSMSVGGGHLKAAEALGDYIKKMDSKSEMIIIDTLKYVSPVVNKIIVSTYMNMLKLTPRIYGKLYSKSDTNTSFVGRNINRLGRGLANILSFKISRLVEEFKPDIVICTHPFSVQTVKELNVPTIAILTDYDVHPWYVSEYVDAYVVPHEFLLDDAVNKGVDRQKIYPIGIPVENKFLRNFERKDILNEFGLNDKATILVMGGSLGLGRIEDVVLKLLESKKDFQIIVVTGSNEKLKKRLNEQILNIHNKSVLLLGYTDKVNKLMEIADFIITKPGGLTISESLIKKLPIFIISPIPGQEERNSDFLVEYGMAFRLENIDDIDNFLDKMINDNVTLEGMKKIAGVLAKPDVCKDIYDLICELLKRNINNKMYHDNDCVNANKIN